MLEERCKASAAIILEQQLLATSLKVSLRDAETAVKDKEAAIEGKRVALEEKDSALMAKGEVEAALQSALAKEKEANEKAEKEKGELAVQLSAEKAISTRVQNELAQALKERAERPDVRRASELEEELASVKLKLAVFQAPRSPVLSLFYFLCLSSNLGFKWNRMEEAVMGIEGQAKGAYVGNPVAGFGVQIVEGVSYLVCDVIKHSDKTVYPSAGLAKDGSTILGFLMPKSIEQRKTAKSIKIVARDQKGGAILKTPTAYNQLSIVPPPKLSRALSPVFTSMVGTRSTSRCRRAPSSLAHASPL